MYCMALFQRDLRRGRKDGVQVVGHDDEGVELVSFLIAVVGESFEEKVGIGFYLK